MVFGKTVVLDHLETALALFVVDFLDCVGKLDTELLFSLVLGHEFTENGSFVDHLLIRLEFYLTVSRILSCLRTFIPLLKRPPLLVSTKCFESQFLGILLVFEHLCNPLPLLVYFMQGVSVHKLGRPVTVCLGDHIHSLSVVSFNLVRVFVCILDELHRHSEFLSTPLRECRTTVSLPEHSSNPAKLLVLIASQTLVSRELLDMLEAIVEGRLRDHVNKCVSEGRRLLRVLSPEVEEPPLATLVIVPVVLHDHETDSSRVAIVGNSRILSNLSKLSNFLASEFFINFV